jgi:hypothetical protein
LYRVPWDVLVSGAFFYDRERMRADGPASPWGRRICSSSRAAVSGKAQPRLDVKIEKQFKVNQEGVSACRSGLTS